MWNTGFTGRQLGAFGWGLGLLSIGVIAGVYFLITTSVFATGEPVTAHVDRCTTQETRADPPAVCICSWTSRDGKHHTAALDEGGGWASTGQTVAAKVRGDHIVLDSTALMLQPLGAVVPIPFMWAVWVALLLLPHRQPTVSPPVENAGPRASAAVWSGMFSGYEAIPEDTPVVLTYGSGPHRRNRPIFGADSTDIWWRKGWQLGPNAICRLPWSEVSGIHAGFRWYGRMYLTVRIRPDVNPGVPKQLVFTVQDLLWRGLPIMNLAGLEEELARLSGIPIARSLLVPPPAGGRFWWFWWS